MAGAAIGSAAGGAIGGIASALGNVAAAKISKPNNAIIGTSGLPSGAFDPAAAFATFDALTQLGIVDPSVLSSASPLSQALSQLALQPISTSRRISLQKGLADIQAKIAQVGGDFTDFAGATTTVTDPFTGETSVVSLLDAKDQRVLNQIAGIVGLSPEQLFQREAAFQQQSAALIEQARPVADAVRTGRLDALQQLSQTGDFAGVQADIRAQLERVLGERQTDILRESNIAGVNPGRQLGKLEEFRQDADVEALARAVQLVSGQQQTLGNVINPGQAATQNIAGIRLGSQIGAGGLTQIQPSNTGQFISAAGANLGGGFQVAGQQIGSYFDQRGPAAPDRFDQQFHDDFQQG